MIDPELLEYAESAGYYTHIENVENGINFKSRRAKDGPNFYQLLSRYSNAFRLSGNTIEPVQQEIANLTLENAHEKNVSGHPAEGKEHDVTLSITASGQLELNDDHTEVTGGNLEITYNYYL